MPMKLDLSSILDSGQMLNPTMTLGEFLNLLDDNPDEFQTILGEILRRAIAWCADNGRDGDGYALGLAYIVVTGACIDEEGAALIVHGMGGLANYVLEVAQNLTPETKARFEAVKNAHPAFAEAPTATGGNTMTRLTKQQKREKRIYQMSDKEWEEANQFSEEVMGQRLDAGGLSREAFEQKSHDLQDKLIAALNEAPLSLARGTLLQLLASSLAQLGTSKDDVAEAAAAFGHVLVECALQLYDERTAEGASDAPAQSDPSVRR
jgi:hypothetical protein